jgi:hypothetical protein
MHPPNHRPTETILGTTYIREDLLRQEAHNSRLARRVRTIARVALVLFAVGIVAAILVGPGVAIGWIGTYLIPMVVLLALGLFVLSLLVGLINRIPLPRGWDRD